MRPTVAVCFLLSACWLLPGEIIDRIAISIGNQVITVAQIEEDVRLTAFLNLEKLDLGASEKQKAADRLIEQALVKRDMEFSPYPPATQSDVDESLRRMQSRFANAAAYQQTLQKYGIAEDGLRRRLEWQLTFQRFTDYRFRAAVNIPEADLQAYYQQQLATLRQQGVQPLPAFGDVRDKLEEILTDRQIDQAIDRWIAETRKQVAVRYHGEVAQ